MPAQKLLPTQMILVLGLIISAYYAVVVLFSVNFPISDDFSILDFLNRFAESDSWSEKTRLLFAQHNEHRIVTTKLSFLLYWIFFGPINFIHLAAFGNLAIFGVFYIVVRHLPDLKTEQSLVLLLAACMVFQYGSAESMIWAMASISNYFLLLFILLTLVFLKKEEWYWFGIAIFFAIVSTYTQGNGLLILPIGGLFLLSQHRYWHASIWTVIAVLVLVTYFIDYQPPGHHSDPLNFYRHLDVIAIYGFAFLGSAFGMSGSKYPILSKILMVLPVVVGFSVCAVTGFLFYKQKYKDGSIFIWINLFIILTAFLTATARINFSPMQALSSRYHVNSSLIVVSTIVLLVHHFPLLRRSVRKRKNIVRFLPSIFVSYTAMTFSLMLLIAFVIYAPSRSGGIIFPSEAIAVEILTKANENAVFNWP